MNQEQAANAVFELLAHAATELQTLGAQSDGNRMYGICCALAAAGTHALRMIYGDRAPDPANGDMWVMQQLKPGALDQDPPAKFAMRFLIAYANNDTDTCFALYNAAHQASGDQYADSVCALLADVAGITRLALDQQKGDR